jgi:hypothetical protein
MATEEPDTGLSKKALKVIKQSNAYLESYKRSTILVTIAPHTFLGSIYSMKDAFDSTYEAVRGELYRRNLNSVAFFPGGIGATGGELLVGIMAFLSKNELLISTIKLIPLLFRLGVNIRERSVRKQQVKLAKRWNGIKPLIEVDLSVAVTEDYFEKNIRYLEDLIEIVPSVYSTLERELSQFHFRISVSITDQDMVQLLSVKFMSKPTFKKCIKSIEDLSRKYIKNNEKNIVVK